MTIEPICYYCKKIIQKCYEIYMFVDKSFCSLYCRNKHMKYIMSIDPDLNNPYKWNNNVIENLTIQVNYSINIKNDLFETKSKTNLYKSESLTNLLHNKENEKYKKYRVLNNFNHIIIKITDNKSKYLMYICLTLIICNIVISSK